MNETTTDFVIEPYPGRDGRSGDKIQVTFRPGGWFVAPRAPKIEGYECFFVSHFGSEKTVYSYRRVKDNQGR